MLFNNRKIGKREIATRIIPSISESREIERLTPGSSNENSLVCIWPLIDRRRVSVLLRFLDKGAFKLRKEMTRLHI
jgi:hypothetical protein